MICFCFSLISAFKGCAHHPWHLIQINFSPGLSSLLIFLIFFFFKQKNQNVN